VCGGGGGQRRRLARAAGSRHLEARARRHVTATVDRTNLWQAQTPQVIRRDLLLRAFAHATATGFAGTDDVSLVEHLGERVAVVMGSATNLKVTRPEDLPLATALLAAGIA
jgi:2-C-methyl-D-erythritol 4-phosphate cytidylyltransferase